MTMASELQWPEGQVISHAGCWHIIRPEQKHTYDSGAKESLCGVVGIGADYRWHVHHYLVYFVRAAANDWVSKARHCSKCARIQARQKL